MKRETKKWLLIFFVFILIFIIILSNSFIKAEDLENTTGTEEDLAIPNTIQTSIISLISPGQPAVVEITYPLIGARRIIINTNKVVQNVSITIKEINASPDEFQIGFSGVSYNTFEIIPNNLNKEDVENVIIEFRVKKTELSKSNLTIEDVFLYRKPIDETDWKVLDTTYLYEERFYHRFSAVSPWLSKFIIFASKTECIPAEKRCLENQVQFCMGNKKWLISEVCDYQCKEGKCIEKGLQINLNPLVVYPIIGIVVVGVLVSFLAQRMQKRRKGKKK